MKRAISLLMLLLLAVINSSAKDIHASMRNCIFLSANDTPYVETQLAVEAQSLRYIKAGKNQFQATVEITILYCGDTGIIRSFKYQLFSPLTKDTSSLNFTLLDLKRVMLNDGDYMVKVLLKDVNDTSSKGYLSERINAAFKKDEVNISDIELVEEYKQAKENSLYTKNGYTIKPQTVAYYPTALNKLSFYAEVYGTSEAFKDKDYLLTFSIVDSKDKKPVSGFYAFSKQEGGKEKMILSGFDISALPGGNYLLLLQVKNDKNEVVTEKSVFFRRTNKSIAFNPLVLKDIIIEPSFVASIATDSVSFFVQSLRPIATDEEVNFIFLMKKQPDTVLMEKFLYSFWKQRAPQYPLESWKKYLAQVYVVEESFKTPNEHGFETDRGRVFLQYGPPNDISDSHSEPGTLPYQIWHYYTIPSNQSNVKFVFYDRDGIPGDMSLIYSNARGETQDPRWKYKIMDAFKEENGFGNIDNTAPTNNSFYSRVSDYFDE